MRAVDRRKTNRSPLREAVKASRGAIIGVAAASGLMNLLMLTGPIFMLQVYDRVLPSRSGATLVGLGIIALVMFAFQGLFDSLRGRILLRIGRSLDQRIGPRVFSVLLRSEPSGDHDGLQSIRDADSIRGFMSGSGLAAVFDLPWMPLYVGVCFAFHPAIGAAVLGGVVLLCGMTFLSEMLTKGPTAELTVLAGGRRDIAGTTRRNAVLVGALGMRGRMAEIWSQRSERYLSAQQNLGDTTSGLGAATRTMRTILQSGVLALGAWLVINQQATGGVMLASTILTIRALAPVESVIANWKGFVAARQAWHRLDEAFAKTPDAEPRTPIPPPRRELSLAGVGLVAPRGQNLVVADVSFAIQAGTALGVVGPSGSGKSSLGRALVGAWQPARGVIRLDGATLDQWSPDVAGAFTGYLPQDVELFDGTIAENIARFQADPHPVALMKAAAAAGVHDLVLRLADGYETQVGEGGILLSGGQRQRIGLARALYGEPFLVVLDEPNANLDTQGEQALTQAIVDVRRRGGIVVVIAHRPSALVAVDRLLVMNEGRVQDFGPRDEVLGRLGAAPFAKPAAAPPAVPAVPAVSAKPPRKSGPRAAAKAGAVHDKP